jgi:hypothetical protein
VRIIDQITNIHKHLNSASFAIKTSSSWSHSIQPPSESKKCKQMSYQTKKNVIK